MAENIKEVSEGELEKIAGGNYDRKWYVYCTKCGTYVGSGTGRYCDTLIDEHMDEFGMDHVCQREFK